MKRKISDYFLRLEPGLLQGKTKFPFMSATADISKMISLFSAKTTLSEENVNKNYALLMRTEALHHVNEDNSRRDSCYKLAKSSFITKDSAEQLQLHIIESCMDPLSLRFMIL